MLKDSKVGLPMHPAVLTDFYFADGVIRTKYLVHGVDSKVAKELSVISCPPNWVTKL